MKLFLNHRAVQHAIQLEHHKLYISEPSCCTTGAPQETMVVSHADAHEEVLPTQPTCAHQVDISIPYLFLCKMRLKKHCPTSQKH